MIGFEHDGVEHAVDAGDGRGLGYERGVDALLDAIGGTLRDAEQLDLVAKIAGDLDVGLGDGGDALDEDFVGRDLAAEAERSEDGELVSGIEATDVEGRVGFGVTQLLRVGEAFGKADALVAHAGQDVIAGAVHDPVDAGDAGRAETLAQSLDDRDAAGDCSLEAKLGIVFLGKAGKRHAVAGKQGLVGGDDRAADLQRSAHRRKRWAILAADQLDEQVDAVGFGERHRIVEPLERRRVDPAIAGAGPRADGSDDDRPADLAGEFSAVLLQDAHERRADIAKTGDADAQRRGGRRFGLILHGLEDARPGVGARLAAFAQVEDEQRIAGYLAAEAGRGPAA